MDLFLLRKLAAALVLPPTGPLLLAIAGALLLRRRPRIGGVLLWTGLLTLLALSLGPVSHGLLQLANDGPPLRAEDAKTAQAVVVLGGGLRREAPEYGGDTLGRLSLERVRYGAQAKDPGWLLPPDPWRILWARVLSRSQEADRHAQGDNSKASETRPLAGRSRRAEHVQ